MRKHRHRAGPEVQMAYYDLESIIVRHQPIFGEKEREYFRKLVESYAEFGGLEVKTCVVTDDRFFLYLGVPRRPKFLPTDDELLARIKAISRPAVFNRVRRKLAQLRADGLTKKAEELRESYFRRMWNLSAFMKMVKQIFSQWYNALHDLHGALWSERFWSVLRVQVEARTRSLVPVREIHLGPAGLLGNSTRHGYPKVFSCGPETG